MDKVSIYTHARDAVYNLDIYRYKIPVIVRSLLELSKQGRLGPRRELIVYVL